MHGKKMVLTSTPLPLLPGSVDYKKSDVRFIRLHDLRRTSATLLINQGIHAKIISERLGHSDIKVTMNTYGHALRRADHEAANKLNDLFSKKG
ncbi:tyrosine-type recombinase/integrase [Cytobacillus purgationiresistens]|uniref:Integrase n=1 Tax=Cytobacillus purgationiresistens TaxID=863449 RepID=A0ABU0ABM3_9BACI|nr:tyrosine-type recombinase/integrase [Cytobacillus purgationiresistens]MDQ0268658.1 integrase [Cytobacillus purgationiresistens]